CLIVVMFDWYCSMAACSRLRRDRRTLSMGSSDGRRMRLPLASCWVREVMRSWFFWSVEVMIAWYWLLAMRMVSSLTHHRQRRVEQRIRDGDDLQVGVVHFLVFDEIDGFLVLVDAARRLPVGIGLVAQ